MRKLFLITMLILISASFVSAQETLVLKADSISNSQSEYGIVDLDRIGAFDSISVSIYAMGEIDLDSLDVKGGLVVDEITYKNATVRNISVYEAIASQSQTLTINNADGTATYVDDITTITKAEARGYNSLKFTVIAASSGNDATDDYQKYIMVATVYR